MVSIHRGLAAVLVALGVLACAAVASAQLQQPPLQQVEVSGAHYFSQARILDLLHLKTGAPLPEPPTALAEALRKAYVTEGYSFARVDARFEPDGGRLILTVDEGHLDSVEFVGVPSAVARDFATDFALQPGDVFRQPQAGEALTALLRRTDGAVNPADARSPDRRSPFQLVSRDGQHVLVVHLVTRRGDFDLATGTHGREDWFNPVDGFSPAIGFDQTIFASSSTNHTFITARLSYKFAPGRVGYRLGFERPFLVMPRVFVNAELHDETASDDLWRVSELEQSLAAFGLRKSFRDYYRRRGYQLGSAIKFGSAGELLLAWRDERHEALSSLTDFSVIRRDEPWRANAQAAAGRLHSVVIGYTWDSRPDQESRAARYERHQLADLFGTYNGHEPGWRMEWTTEIASADRLGGDFSFRRHILNVRRYNRLSPRQSLDGRVLFAAASGQVVPQRMLALGGLGTIPGYAFKESLGQRFVVVNAEYRYRPRRWLAPVVRYDGGRTFKDVSGTRGWMHSIGGGVMIGGDLRLEVVRPLESGRGATFLVRLTPTF